MQRHVGAAAAAAAAKHRRELRHPLAAAVASQYFLTRTDAAWVNLSQNGRQKARNGRHTRSARATPLRACLSPCRATSLWGESA
jgi:hypothetical protein